MSDFVFENEERPVTRIKVVGVGGGGCNAIDSMVDLGLPGVEFYAVNTDGQALEHGKCPNKIQIGREITHGLGTGGDPALGEKAAAEDRDLLTSMLEGGDMVFITACLGGGAGTGATPVIAELAKSLGLLTVCIVTKPFQFEGPQRKLRAQQGVDRLRDYVDALVVVMNDKLLEVVGSKTTLVESFTMVNDILAQGVSAISDLICRPGRINADFQDVRTVMGDTGGAVLGFGTGKGESRATEAIKKACSASLQEKIQINGARRVLVSIVGGSDITLHEVNEAASLVYEAADPDANIIFSAVIDERLTDEVRVTIIATGFGEEIATVSAASLGAREKTPQRPMPALPPKGAVFSAGGLGLGELIEPSATTPAAPALSDMETPDGLLQPSAAADLSFEDTFVAPPREAPATADTLDSWSHDIDDSPIDKSATPGVEFAQQGGYSASAPEAPNPFNYDRPSGNFGSENLETPAINRRRTSFFS